MHASQRFAFLALSIFCTVCRADATLEPQAPPTRCELHEPHSAVLDPQELALRTAHPSDLVRVCTTAGRAPEYSLLTVPVHIGPELCRYTERHPGPDARSTTYVRQERGLCPLPGKASYFWIDAVPDDVWPRLLDLLREMAASDAGFDKAAASLDAAKTPGSAAQFADFRHAMRSGATHLLGIERIDPSDDLKSGWFLTFDDAAYASRTWRLGIVPDGDRLLLRRIDEGAID